MDWGSKKTQSMKVFHTNYNSAHFSFCKNGNFDLFVTYTDIKVHEKILLIQLIECIVSESFYNKASIGSCYLNSLK